jgi:hypothetical protein
MYSIFLNNKKKIYREKPVLRDPKDKQLLKEIKKKKKNNNI